MGTHKDTLYLALAAESFTNREFLEHADDLLSRPRKSLETCGEHDSLYNELFHAELLATDRYEAISRSTDREFNAMIEGFHVPGETMDAELNRTIVAYGGAVSTSQIHEYLQGRPKKIGLSEEQLFMPQTLLMEVARLYWEGTDIRQKINKLGTLAEGYRAATQNATHLNKPRLAKMFDTLAKETDLYHAMATSYLAY